MVNINFSVAKMYGFGWSFDGGGWRWHRCLFAWEKDKVREHCATLNNFVLQVNAYDKWIWSLDLDKGFSVKRTYWLLSIMFQTNYFVWRFFNNRLCRPI